MFSSSATKITRATLTRGGVLFLLSVMYLAAACSEDSGPASAVGEEGAGGGQAPPLSGPQMPAPMPETTVPSMIASSGGSMGGEMLDRVPDESPPQGGDGAPRLECTTFEVDECPQDRGCRPLMARIAFLDDAGQWAVDEAMEPMAIACVDVRALCANPGAFYTAPAAPDVCYGLQGGCPPPGWSACALGPAPPSCEERPVTLCAEDARCIPVTAQPGIWLGDDGFRPSSEPREAVVCAPADQACDDALTYAAPFNGHGTCYEFANTCTPPEWIPCEAVDLAEASQVPCVARAPALCVLPTGAMCQPIHGQAGILYDDGDFVPQEPQFTERVGCRDRGMDCASELTYGQPTGGVMGCFRFTTRCIPSGWGACVRQPRPPEVSCEARSVADCIASGDTQCTHIRARSGRMGADMMFTPSGGATLEAVGCREFDGICGFGTRHSAAPETPTLCYEFVTDCVPPGWVDCAPAP